MHLSSRPGPRPRWRSVLAAMLAAVLALGVATTFAPAAAAASGTLTDLTVLVTDDGTAPAALGIDDAGDNGVVATNNTVTMTWSLSGDGLTDGVLTQTLPEGWTWVTSSLDKLVSESSVYKSSYVLSDGGRTVTATISLPSNALVSVTGLQAKVGGTVAVGSQYTPAVTGTDSTGSRTATTGALTVAGTPQISLTAGSSSVNASTTHDFGSGDEAASLLKTSLTYTYSSSLVGQDTSGVLDLPHTFTMTYDGPTADDITLNADASSWLRIDSVVGQTVTLTMISQPTSGTSTTLNRWYAATSMPAQDAAITVTTTTVQPDLTLTDGTVVQPGGTASSSASLYYAAATVPVDTLRAATNSITNTVYSWAAGMSAPDLPISNTNVTGWVNRTTQVGTGAYVASKSEYHPASYSISKDVQATHNLVGYQFWDSSLARISGLESDVWVGTGSDGTDGVALPSSAYTLQFSPDQSIDGPWFDTIAAAGGAAAVQGVRMALTSAWGEGTTYDAQQSTVRLIVPQVVLWDQITDATLVVKSRWTADEHDVKTADVSVGLAAVVFRQTISSTPARLVSGNVLTYVVGESSALGQGTPATSTPVVMSQTVTRVSLPANITAVDYQDALDQGWVVSSYTAADWGPDGLPGTSDDVHGPIIDFVWPSDIVVDSTTFANLPGFTVTALTSLQAPTASNGVVTATAAATYTTASRGERTVSASASSTMLQVDTLTMDGAAPVPVIQPSDTTVEWDTNWYNFGKDSKSGAAYVLDVLPYNGDGRGTDTTATLTLQSVTPLGDAQRGTLEFTTTDPADIGEHGENAVWQPIVSGTDLSAATAVRLSLDGLPAGAVGALRMVLGITGQSGDDVLVNSGTGWVGDSVTLGSGDYTVRVAQSAIQGTVWEDVDGDGTWDSGESGIAGVRVVLLSGGTAVGSTRTGADGTYGFEGLSAGDYQVQVDTSTFATPLQQTAGAANSTADVTALSDQTVTDVDFGYTDAQLALTVSGTGTAPDPVVAGGVATLVYTVANSGANDLTGVTLSDTLDPARVESSTWAWPGADGSLAVGESATLTVQYTVDQGEVDAGAVATTVSATGWYLGQRVDSAADVTVPLVAAGSLGLVVSGELSGPVEVGATLTWTATVTNTSALTLTTVAVSAPGVTWAAVTGDLAPGQSTTMTGTSLLTQEQIDAGAAGIEASATASTLLGDPVSATARAEVPVTGSAGLTLDLLLDGAAHPQSPGAAVDTGQQLAWTYVLTNTGTVTLTGLVVSDDLSGRGDLVLPAGFDGTLAPGDSVTLGAASEAVAGTVSATAVATGTSATGTEVTATATAWYTGAVTPVIEPTPTPTPTPTATTPTETTSTGSSSVLAVTGASVAGAAAIALLLIGAGVLVRRRGSSPVDR